MLNPNLNRKHSGKQYAHITAAVVARERRHDDARVGARRLRTPHDKLLEAADERGGAVAAAGDGREVAGGQGG